MRKSDHRQDKQYEDDDRQNIAHVVLHPLWKVNALARVDLGEEVLPTPTVARGTEDNVDHTAEGQEDIRDGEVLKIEESLAQNCNVRPDVQAEDGGKAEQGDQRNIDD